MNQKNPPNKQKIKFNLFDILLQKCENFELIVFDSIIKVCYFKLANEEKNLKDKTNKYFTEKYKIKKYQEALNISDESICLIDNIY